MKWLGFCLTEAKQKCGQSQCIGLRKQADGVRAIEHLR